VLQSVGQTRCTYDVPAVVNVVGDRRATQGPDIRHVVRVGPGGVTGGLSAGGEKQPQRADKEHPTTR
jgi:hypothetical protein